GSRSRWASLTESEARRAVRPRRSTHPTPGGSLVGWVERRNRTPCFSWDIVSEAHRRPSKRTARNLGAEFACATVGRTALTAQNTAGKYLMRGLPEDQKTLFGHAVRTFRGEGPVRVSPEKLGAFLHDTRDIPRTPADRLRWLAIGLEHDRFERGWEDLRAIYQAAADADPKDPFVLHSWGISAHDWMEDWMTPELSDR